jgi:hypothetical protein
MCDVSGTSTNAIIGNQGYADRGLRVRLQPKSPEHRHKHDIPIHDPRNGYGVCPISLRAQRN